MAPHVRYHHERGTVTAYLGQGNPYDESAGCVILGTAERFMLKHGAGFSGWVVRVGRDYSDPIALKADAVAGLRREAEAVAHLYIDRQPIPTKVERFLDKARKGGLRVEGPKIIEHGSRVWTVESPLAHEHEQIWVFWNPGARDGRMTVMRYDVFALLAKRHRSATEKLTRHEASIAVELMSKAVRRAANAP